MSVQADQEQQMWQCVDDGPGTASLTHWDALARRLAEHGVRHVFGLPADDLASYRAVVAAGLEFHLANDQRQAGYQAIASVAGYHQSVGVLFLGKGPAVTHAATAILEAREQRVPLLVITTGVGEQRWGSGAFQELNAAAVLAPLTLHQLVASHPGQVEERLDELIGRATGAKRGPVLLEIPEDFMQQSFTPSRNLKPVRQEPEVGSAVAQDGQWLQLLQEAKRPGLLIGAGARHVLEAGQLREVAARYGLAVLATASGRGVYDEQDAHFVGVAGLYLQAEAREHVAQIDVLLVLGSRLEETALCGWETDGVSVVQVNLAKADFRAGLEGVRVQSCASQVVAAALEVAPAEAAGTRGQWATETRRVHRMCQRAARTWRSPIGQALSALQGNLAPDSISVHENGLHDIWSYNWATWPIRKQMGCLVPSEQTPLGFGVAAALGLARIQEREVVCISGDGAFLTMAGELGHLCALRAPLLYVVLNNQGYGWLQANLQVADPLAGPVFCPMPTAGDAGADLVAGYARAAGLEVMTVDLRGVTHGNDAKQFAQRIAHAVRERQATATGRRTAMVLNLLVELADVPPGFEELAGDVPAWAAGSAGGPAA